MNNKNIVKILFPKAKLKRPTYPPSAYYSVIQGKVSLGTGRTEAQAWDAALPVALYRAAEAIRSTEHTGDFIEVAVCTVTSSHGNKDAAIVGNPNDTICISLEDKQGYRIKYDDDAKHLQTWCDEHGFTLTVTPLKIPF